MGITYQQKVLMAIELGNMSSEKRTQIRFVIASYLLETALKNGKLRIPFLDDIEFYVHHGMTLQDTRRILSILVPWRGNQSVWSPMDEWRNGQLIKSTVPESDYILVQTIFAMLLNESRTLMPISRELSSFESSINTIYYGLAYAGVPDKEIYPVMLSLMDLRDSEFRG